MERFLNSGLLRITAGLILLVSCSREDEIIHTNLSPWLRYGSMTDQDGINYKTIEIGTQTWMAGNLKATSLNDGTPILQANDASSWNNTTAPACCWQQNNPAYRVTYGLLYNWHTVGTGKLCPKGWHVPSDAEWTKLTDYLGGDLVAGGKLKESGFSHWFDPNTGATNETGFKALPGGSRLNGTNGLFVSLHETGAWWSSTELKDNAASRIMSDNDNKVAKLFESKKYGLSVRCVSDW